VELLTAGHEVLILDSFINAAKDVPDRIADITRRAPSVARLDITDAPALTDALRGFEPDAVLHFAGLKAVGDAVADPLEYYRVNVGGSLTLMRTMEATGCHRIVFSSSATVYGEPDIVPTPEDHPLRPANPYGQSKRMVEQMITDWGVANQEVAAINLRYFNPVGAHESAMIGEAPQGVPNNLMPYVAQVAAGQQAELLVFGDDYKTPDGTGVRDYIHVVDLAEAHLAALKLADEGPGTDTLNVGTGRGYSVLEMIEAFSRETGCNVPYRIVPRRPGDVAIYLADPSRAHARMGWRATRDLDAMCRDAWAWQSYLAGRNSGK
jgi:UDP-glucose 4-epimerase